MSRALGRYELLRPLARGGMAEVFLARRRAGGVEKLLVVKRVRPERAGDARFLDLFVREARLSMSLTHQNIVPVFDFGRSGDQVFLAMERVEGKDLGSSLQHATGLMPPLVAAFVAAECCQALDYAHRRKAPDGTALGIVHRDVTPRNVLLSWSGEVKLTDFGIAAVTGDSTSRLFGTPAYMAPEQARSEPLDARADVYAIGLVLREAVTGCRPRGGADLETLIANARAGELEPWPAHVTVPEALRAIVDRATAPTAADRFPDAQAMLGELDTFIVADRASIKGSSPARQLEAWLEATWGTDRTEDTSGELPSDAELLSFVDDFEAIGAGTSRSLLATAADDGEIPTPASRPEAAPVPPPMPPAVLPARRRWLALAFAISLAAITVWWLDRPEAPDARPSSPSPVAQDDRPVVLPSVVTPAIAVDGSVAPLAASDAPVIDASVIDAPTREPPHRDAGARHVTPPPVDAGTPAPLRRVTINALPWANFTIDHDPTLHQTIDTLELRAGRHTLHFSNAQLGIERDVVIEVPPDYDIKHVTNLREP